LPAPSKSERGPAQPIGLGVTREPASLVESARSIPIDRLQRAPWNANRVPPKTLAKIRHSIEEFGVVENLVARPHPEHDGDFEVVSGNHRLELLRELGVDEVPVVVVEVDDAHARILAQTLNRTRGADDPEAYARLLDQVLSEMSRDDVLSFLPETDASLERALASLPARDLSDADDAPPPPHGRSRLTRRRALRAGPAPALLWRRDLARGPGGTHG
jgi:ParB-like chromosome segregation protein Spo0J